MHSSHNRIKYYSSKSKMEKIVIDTGVTSLGYESIGDRISRLRKQASLPRPRQRPTCQPSFDKPDKVLDSDPSQKQNKYRIDSLLTRTNTEVLTLASPRKCGITRRQHFRYPTEDDSEVLAKVLTTIPATTRMPGKICRNVNKSLVATQSNGGLRLGARFA